MFAANRSLTFLLVTLLCATSAGATPVEIIPAELSGAMQPQVTVAPAGRIHVTFRQR